MEVIHQGFDGLDVSFEANISADLAEVLAAYKEMATEQRQAVLLSYNGVLMHVAPDGGVGGYAFRASTGPMGGTWFFKKPNPRDRWGVRYSSNAAPLAIEGVNGVRDQIQETLEAFGIVPTGMSIARVDYAIDVLAPTFELDPECVTVDAPAGRADYKELGERADQGPSGRYTSTRIGRMPGWQVAIYDKRHEVLKKHKVHWPRIWNALREHDGKPPLDFSDPTQSRIWRFEFRAGKRRLKQFKIRTWADFDERVGDLLVMAATIVRYRQPNNDSNRSRWPQHPIWSLVQEALAKGLAATRSGATPSDIREVYRDEQRRLLTQQIEGLAINLAALDGCTTAEEVSMNTAKVLMGSLDGMARHRTPVIDRLGHAAQKYVFL